MIQFQGVSKHYGTHTKALTNVSVDIGEGEFVFLIGPSGAGKTTLLRLLIRDIVDEWTVNTLPISRIHLLRRKIGTVFQDFRLLTDRTAYENVALGLEIRGDSDASIEKAVDSVLALVGLSDKKKLFPLQLSAGELQRTAIARAVVGGPKILLADEKLRLPS